MPRMLRQSMVKAPASMAKQQRARQSGTSIGKGHTSTMNGIGRGRSGKSGGGALHGMGGGMGHGHGGH